MTSLHELNGCLIVPAALVVSLLAIVWQRRGKGMTPGLLAAVLLVGLQAFAQAYMGVMLLDDRRRRSLLHYSLGLLPVLILLVAFQLVPQLKERRALGLGLGLLAAALSTIIAFFIG